MCKSDDNVSPYLRRPVRTYAQFLRDRAKRARGASKRIESPTGPSTGGSPKREGDDVEPRK